MRYGNSIINLSKDEIKDLINLEQEMEPRLSIQNLIKIRKNF